jgi:hypothetical protein
MIPEKKEDLNIFYMGGHGGFFFLHLLLLSEEYRCNFGDDSELPYDLWFKNFKEHIYTKQWEPSNEWKKNEVWPENELTLSQQYYDKAKVLYTCNKLPQWRSFPGKSAIIYTDIHTELRLSYYKKASLFYKTGPNKIESVTGVKKILRRTELIDGKLYKKGMAILLNQFDIRINLHELIKDPENVLRNNFNISCNDAQKMHIKYWLSLHPKKLLEKAKLSINT